MPLRADLAEIFHTRMRRRTRMRLGYQYAVEKEEEDDASTTTESRIFISPNGRIRRKIRSWNRGVLLGSGSFGTVYEGISE